MITDQSASPLPGDPVSEQLAQLSDLFRRRLLEDRNQRQLIAEQQERIARPESDLSGERLIPLLRGLRLVVGRARAHSEDGIGESIAEEIIEALIAFGIDPIDQPGTFDPSRHEVVEVDGSPTIPAVSRIVSVGFAKHGHTLIPAQVAVSEAQ